MLDLTSSRPKGAMTDTRSWPTRTVPGAPTIEPQCRRVHGAWGLFFVSRGAVAGAVHDAEKGSPRADRIAILVGHYAGELMKVSQIVRGPRG
jgi:hypothetical protein